MTSWMYRIIAILQYVVLLCFVLLYGWDLPPCACLVLATSSNTILRCAQLWVVTRNQTHPDSSWTNSLVQFCSKRFWTDLGGGRDKICCFGRCPRSNLDNLVTHHDMLGQEETRLFYTQKANGIMGIRRGLLSLNCGWLNACRNCIFTGELNKCHFN